MLRSASLLKEPVKRYADHCHHEIVKTSPILLCRVFELSDVPILLYEAPLLAREDLSPRHCQCVVLRVHPEQNDYQLPNHYEWQHQVHH